MGLVRVENHLLLLLKVNGLQFDLYPYFCHHRFYCIMANQQQQHLDKEFGRNWVSSSRFLFYIQLVALAAFVFGCSVNLYKSTYQGKPKVEVQESSQYTPKYK